MRNAVYGSITILLLAFAGNALATPAHLWSEGVVGTGYSKVSAVAINASGEIAVAGIFTGVLNLGGANLTAAAVGSLFLAKFTAAGYHIWSNAYTLEGDVYNIAFDTSGNILLAGFFYSTANLGGANLVSAGNDDMLLAKYNQYGGHVWSKRFGTASADEGADIAADASGNVLFSGYGGAGINFGGGAIGAAGQNAFVVKFTSAGVHVWSTTSVSTGGGATCTNYSLALDGAGDIVTTGQFFQTVSFGGGNLVSAGFSDIYLAKYSSSGAHVWSQKYGATSADRGYQLAMLGSDVVVAGEFSNTVDFGGGGLVSAGGSDIFLARYNASGAHVWSQRFGASSSDAPLQVGVNGSGEIAVSGYFSGSASLGGSTFVASGGQDAFVAKYAATGAHVWSRAMGGIGSDYGEGVTVDGNGDVVTGGGFLGTADFGAGAVVSHSFGSGYLARYSTLNVEPAITSIVDVENDQGKQVRISFVRSGQDDPLASDPVTRYVAYRRIDTLPAASLEREPASVASGRLMVPGYEFAGEIPAFAADSYNLIVPTLADSTEALGQHYSAFFIRAALALPVPFYDSVVDSGYSVDNLAPGVPLNFSYTAGDLSWDESLDADFDYFTVYGGNTSSYGAATLIDYTVGNQLDVNASPYAFYFVTATDFSGNEGKPAKVNTLSGAGTPKHYVLSISAYPNPFNPETTVRYTLPSRGRVTLEIFDPRGAHVASLLDAEKAAGAYTVTWSGRDDRGNAVGSGIYFARLTSPAGSRSYKLTLLK